MTPKELYEWAVERGVEDYDITVDGDAIDYMLPDIDELKKEIESHENRNRDNRR